MRVAVLSSADSWYVRDLQRAGGHRHRIEPVPFSGISSRIGGTLQIEAGATDLTTSDVVLVRTMPPGSLEQVVFRMDALHCLQKKGIPVINQPRAIETAVDKYLTLARLEAEGFDVPKTDTSQTIEEAMAGFSQLGGDVVLKPLFGSEGRGITRISDEAIAERSFKLLIQLGAVVHQQEFVEHEGCDLRLLCLEQQVLGMRRSNRLDWRTNVSRGATTEPLNVTDELAEMAHRAANAVDAVIAGVDLLPAKDGRLLAIEVNAVPGWRALGRTLQIDVSQRVLEVLERKAC